jgi:hypothetical protein
VSEIFLKTIEVFGCEPSQFIVCRRIPGDFKPFDVTVVRNEVFAKTV